MKRVWELVNFPDRCPCDCSRGLCVVLCANARCGQLMCELLKWAVKNNTRPFDTLTGEEKVKLQLARLLAP